MKRLFKKILELPFLILMAGVLVFSGCSKRSELPEAQMVILIGIDGMSISGFQRATTPNLDELVRKGALSFKTRSVMPSVSGPNWASHLMGAGPEQHAVTMNGWTRETSKIAPAETDEDGCFPSVFSVVRQQMPQARLGFFYDWDALMFFTNPKNIDKIEYAESFPGTFEMATPWIIENQPEFTFIYVGHPDEVGHEFKWESPEYIRSLEEVDAAIGELFRQLKEARLFEKIHFIVVSDHGGIEYGHGEISQEEMVIPWMISGPGVIRDRMIEQPNDVYNTASTIVSLLGLKQPVSWIGRPVFGAFEGSDLSKQNTNAYVQDPVASIKSGLYTSAEYLSLSVLDPKAEIRFTMDGSNPGEDSELYREPLFINKDTRVKAMAFRETFRSRITEADIKLVQPVDKIHLRPMPSQKYFSEGAETLINRVIASGEFTDGQWLGFESKDMEATLDLPEISAISTLSVGYLNNPYSWIFPPTFINLQGSVDGETFFDLGNFDETQITAQAKAGRNELRLMLPAPVDVKYIRVNAGNAGVCPPGHSGEGQPAWLFVDEILIQ